MWNAARLLDGTNKIIGFIASGQDITKRNLALEELRIRNRVAEVFLTKNDEEMYGNVLEIVLEEMKSRFGVFGYIDRDGTLVCPSMTKNIWDKCQIPDKDIVFPRETWGNSIWARALIEGKTIYSNKIIYSAQRPYPR